MERKRHRLVLPLALVGAALLTTPALAAGTPQAVRVSGPSPYAACTAGGPGTVYTNAEVEPYVAVSPANSKTVIGAWQQDRWADGGAHGLVAGYSSDGGQTWGETPLPFDACAPGGLAYTRASDPWVSIGPDGTAYSNAIVFDETDNNNGVAAVSSTDGGRTWGNLAVVDSHTGTTQFFDDKNSITANPKIAGAAYSVWDDLRSPNANPYADAHAAAYNGDGYFSMTADGGRTWSAPKAIFPTKQRTQTIGNQVVVDPRSPKTLYDFANWIVQPNNGNKETDQLAFVKSTDGGATWSAPKVVAPLDDVGVTDPNTGAGIRTGEIIPEVAIGADGSIAAVWQDAAWSGGAYDEVAFSRSTDGGSTWTAPARISTPTGRASFNPQVSIAPDGTIGVDYYDFRNLAAGNTSTLPTDYWFKSSKNGGRTWSADTHLAGPFDTMVAPNAGGFFLGDYAGLANGGGVFHPLWTQTTCADGTACPTAATDRTDVYTAAVTP
ncbi:sialidase family protein [Phaeacidiphilus oryzae]|uniref:sialidase family protein n=1 Tax=Phaeacidiphilus oryzae TaxID=348818 RepID=UPI00056BAB36|nr:sialidase family protein [Phaeacidiphilus oryzae]